MTTWVVDGARVALTGNIGTPYALQRQVKHESRNHIEVRAHSVTFCVKYRGYYAFRG